MTEPTAPARGTDWTGRAVTALLVVTVALNVWWLWRSFTRKPPARPAARAMATVNMPERDTAPREKPAAPAFSLATLDGGIFALKPDDHKVTLIDFFATWCQPCREELPTVDGLAKKYAPTGVRVVAVDAEPPEAKEFVEKLHKDLGLGLPIALAGSDVASSYGVENLPHVVIVGADGKIARTFIGVQEAGTLADAIEAARKP